MSSQALDYVLEAAALSMTLGVAIVALAIIGIGLRFLSARLQKVLTPKMIIGIIIGGICLFFIDWVLFGYWFDRADWA